MPTPAAPCAAVRTGTTPALVLEGVTRWHGGRSTWAPLDLRLEAGTVCVVTGANGSGKTTLLRLAAGLLRPTGGTRLCAGTALYVHAGAGLRGAQTLADAVAGTAGLAGRRWAVPAALALLGLQSLGSRRVGTLSAGERVRGALAAVLAARPAVVCLDEPTGALDEQGVALLLLVLAELRAGGCATLVASHQPGALVPHAEAHLRFASGRLEAV